MGCSTHKDVTSLHLVRSYYYAPLAAHPPVHDNLLNVLTPPRKFLKACLTHNHNNCVDIGGVERLDFYKDVNWKKVVAWKMEPPYYSPRWKSTQLRGSPIFTHLIFYYSLLLTTRTYHYNADVFRTSVASMMCVNWWMDELSTNSNFISPHKQYSSYGINGSEANLDSSFQTLSSDLWSKCCLVPFSLVCFCEFLIWLKCKLLW
ncbi:hypothetical protein TSMEX_002999 [Taenia solium]|eukprot:TsM_000872300 transcript=TsM_000872300 gene=TsM_000872300